MPIRLSSFLSSIQSAIPADAPQLAGGAWEMTRHVNFHLGLARLHLGVRDGKLARSLGSILVQAFDLPEGSVCLKATLCWTGQEDTPEASYSIYQRSGIDWEAEAGQVAGSWLSGPPSAPIKLDTAEAGEPALAVAG